MSRDSSIREQILTLQFTKFSTFKGIVHSHDLQLDLIRSVERLIETLDTIQFHCIFLYRVDGDWGCHFALHLPLFQQKKYMRV